MSRLNAVIYRKRGDRSYTIKIGAAFPHKQGPGYQILLDALPLPDAEGRCVINLFESKKREDDRNPVTDEQRAHEHQVPPDDEIPW